MKRCSQLLITDFIGICPAAKRTKFTTETVINNGENPSTISTPQEISKSIPKPINIFVLNGDCMRRLFDYCSIVDLFNMAMASDEMQIAVFENGVRGRLFDFGELALCCHILDVFKVFGQHMTKIKIGEKDIQYKATNISKFDEILRLIATYCSVDTLKYLNLQFYYGTSIKKRYMYAALPFFCSIESLTINETDQSGIEENDNYFSHNPKYNHSINDFVERVIGKASKITSIELFHLKITGRFFHLPHLHNLKTLSIVGCNVRVPDGFIAFLLSKPQLKSFTWDMTSLYGLDTNTSHSSNMVYELVAKHIPDLEALYYHPNEGFVNEQSKYVPNLFFIPPQYEILANFDKLKVLSFPQMTIDGLKILAKKNTVEKLNCFHRNIYTIDLHTLLDYYQIFPMDDDLRVPPVDLGFLDNYSNIRSIRLLTPGGLKEFNIALLSKLPHLTECSLVFLLVLDYANDVISAVVESARHLSTLNILSVIDGFPIELYAELLEIRLRHGSSSSLTIYLKLKKIAKFLSRLGEIYRPDVITICAAT